MGKAIPSGFSAHPYADLFPLHEGKPLWDLRDDIKENGQLEDIVLFHDKVLDGRRRQVACLCQEITPRYTKFKGTDAEALKFVISKNLKRRHLGEAERALVAASIAKLSKGGDRGNQHTGGKPSPDGLPTQAVAAEMLNVSPKAVERAKSVLDSGTPALQEAVKEGTVTLSDAAAVSKQPPKIQNAAVKAVEEGKTAAAVQEATKLVMKMERKEGKKESKNGAILFDDRKITDLIRKMVQTIDARAAVHGKTAGFKDFEKHLEHLATSWDRWQQEKLK